LRSTARGIASVWVEVDGNPVAELPQPCAGDVALSCANLAAPVSLTIDSLRITEGRHRFVVGVMDGDGYDTIAFPATSRSTTRRPLRRPRLRR
jgi:hypothetical protein